MVRLGSLQECILPLKRRDTDTRREYWPGERGRREQAWEQESPGGRDPGRWRPLLPALPTPATPEQKDVENSLT